MPWSCLASAGGNDVAVIARLVQTSPDRVREMIPSCTPAEKTIAPNSGAAGVALGPVDTTPASAVGAILQGAGTGAATLLRAVDSVTPMTITYRGCDATWSDGGTLTFTADVPPGEYRVFPDEFIFRFWTFSTPRNLTYVSGDLPTIVVTR